MSYIQKEIGGKLRGLKFNQMATVIFYSKVDQDNAAATSIYALIWAGLKSNAYVKGEEFTETFETVCDWIDQIPTDEQVEITKCYMETQAFKDVLAKGDDKKKLISKSTKRNALKSP